VGRSLDRLARAYELASQLDRAIETSREAASTMVAARRHDPATRPFEGRRTDIPTARFPMPGASSRPQGRPAAADWRSAQTAFERAAAMLNGLDGGVNLTERDQQRIGSMTAALEDCRRRLLRGSRWQIRLGTHVAPPPHQHQFTLRYIFARALPRPTRAKRSGSPVMSMFPTRTRAFKLYCGYRGIV